MNIQPRSVATTPQTRTQAGVLRSLEPVFLQPHWRSNLPSVSNSLLAIERLHVAPLSTKVATMKVSYLLSTSSRRTISRIPTVARYSKPVTSPSVPFVQETCELPIPHSIEEFSSLRDSIHSCIQQCGPGSMCQFCERLSAFLTWGSGRALVFATLTMNKTIDASEELAGFMNFVLEECRVLLESGERGGCRGQRHVPFLINTFVYSAPGV